MRSKNTILGEENIYVYYSRLSKIFDKGVNRLVSKITSEIRNFLNRFSGKCKRARKTNIAYSKKQKTQAATRERFNVGGTESTAVRTDTKRYFGKDTFNKRAIHPTFFTIT